METGGLHMKRIITIIMGVCITISCVACSADDRKKVMITKLQYI